MRVLSVALLSAVLLVVSGCRESTGPEYAMELSITDSVVARRSQNDVSVLVQVRARNLDTRPVYYSQCGHALQRRDGNVWRAVQLEPCRNATQFSFEISVGASALFTLRGRASPTSSEWPATGAPGEYRVVLWLTASPNNTYGIPIRPLSLSSRVTPVFSVREIVIVL
jgi:hypothetical protein